MSLSLIIFLVIAFQNTLVDLYLPSKGTKYLFLAQNSNMKCSLKKVYGANLRSIFIEPVTTPGDSFLIKTSEHICIFLSKFEHFNVFLAAYF